MRDGEVELDQVERQEGRVKRLARGLDGTGDLGVWVEWIRQEVRKSVVE